MPTERFMRHYYGASGFVPKESEKSDDKPRMMVNLHGRSEKGEQLPPHEETPWCHVIGCQPMCNQPTPVHQTEKTK